MASNGNVVSRWSSPIRPPSFLHNQRRYSDHCHLSPVSLPSYRSPSFALTHVSNHVAVCLLPLPIKGTGKSAVELRRHESCPTDSGEVYPIGRTLGKPALPVSFIVAPGVPSQSESRSQGSLSLSSLVLSLTVAVCP